MTKINKIAIILMLLVFCALCSFGLVGCRSKDPNDPSYWYGTYEQYGDLFINLITHESPVFAALAKITTDGFDYYEKDGTLVHRDVRWGEDYYRQLQQGMHNISHKVKITPVNVKMNNVKWSYGIKIWEGDEAEAAKHPNAKRLFHFMLPKEDNVDVHHLFNEPAEGEYDTLTYNIRYNIILKNEQSCRVTFIVQYRRKAK